MKALKINSMEELGALGGDLSSINPADHQYL